MITYKTGDIFNTTARVLVNPVNCVGVMGAGLAQQFATAFPGLVETYKATCQLCELRPGAIQVIVAMDSPETILVINAATKEHWKNPSQITWIEKILISVVNEAESVDYMPKIAMPKLGCGLGGLDWNDVHELYKRILEPSTIEFEVYV